MIAICSVCDWHSSVTSRVEVSKTYWLDMEILTLTNDVIEHQEHCPGEAIIDAPDRGFLSLGRGGKSLYVPHVPVIRISRWEKSQPSK